MPELKHNFIKGRMNKDLDERLVPNGEYRDALNIEVVNSEGSDMGSAQTTMGNILRSPGVPNGTCVGSIANEKEDKIYWMIAHPNDFNICEAVNIPEQNRNRVATTDIIAEYDFNNNSVAPVVVDVYEIAIPVFNGFNTWPATNILDPIDRSNIRIDMTVTGYNEFCDAIFESYIIDIDSFGHPIVADDINTFFPSLSYVVFSSKRVLNFERDQLITGINVIPASDETTAEGILFWTDNFSEPKRVNINRSKLGSTINWNTHTDFMIRDVSQASLPNTFIVSGPIEEEHITVIRKGPPAAPVLEMVNNKDDELITATLDFSGATASLFFNTSLELETAVPIPGIFFDGCPGNCPGYDINDYIIISAQDDPLSLDVNESDRKIRAQIVGIDPVTMEFTLQILSGDPGIRPDNLIFDVRLEQIDSLFQFKFPRFATRYKYEDGEYSAFSPFTQVAFLPGEFKFVVKEGYNLGMVNQLRYLVIKDFVHDEQLPDDVVSIDILYKESNSPNVYSVKNIKRQDMVGGVWDEWNAITTSLVQTTGTRGHVKLTSELIHATLPSNQLLRPWDNVPRKALAQEISGNRLIYGNYLQNYNLFNTGTNEKDIKVKTNLNLRSEDISGNTLLPRQKDPWQINDYSPAKSIKSLRTYQLGVVYIDEYGRETPVFSQDKTGAATINDTSSTASIYLTKDTAQRANRFRGEIKSTVPEWAKSFKFFIKETSNEYYNLALDRWYDAEDGNVWLSFPSSERNKVDIETFLILKKEHNADIPVTIPARYKILAIENEAPEYVKTDNLSMGVFKDDSAGSLIGPGGAGFPLPKTNEVYLDKFTFDGLTWNTTLLGQDVSTVWFRIRTSSELTDWYQLTSVATLTTGTGLAVLTSKTPFGDDMDITSNDGTYSGRVGGLELEVANRKPTHKPEFEGRFFVKILKDLAFISKVIKPAKDEIQYLVKFSKISQFIDPNSSWASSNWDGYGHDKFKLSASNAARNQVDNGVGQNYWNKAGKGDANTSTGWFIDKVEGYRRCKMMTIMSSAGAAPIHHPSDYGANNQKYITDPTSDYGTTNGQPDSHYNPWDDDPDPAVQVNGINTYETSYGDGNSVQRWSGSSWYHSLTQAFPIKTQPSDQGGDIVPSVGIDKTNNTIHLSFAGIGESHTGTLTNSFATLKSGLVDWPAEHTGDLLFINEITTPGTIWRWKQDPGQVKYQTQHPTNLNTAGQQTTSEWRNNRIDDFDDENGVSLYNYVNFYDFITKTHHRVKFAFGAPEDIASWASMTWDHDYEAYPQLGTFWAAVAASFHDSVSLIWSGTGTKWQDTAGGYASSDAHNKWPSLVDDWGQPKAKRRRYQFHAVTLDLTGGVPLGIGQTPPFFYSPDNDPDGPACHTWTGTPVDDTTTPTLAAVQALGLDATTPAPGIRTDGMHSGYSPNPGGLTLAQINAGFNDEIAFLKKWDDGGTVEGPIAGSVTWQILKPYSGDDTKYPSAKPAVFETEPKEDVGLDIYHEIGQIYPVEINKDTIEQHIGPVHRTIGLNPDAKRLNSYVKCWRPSFIPGTPGSLIGLSVTTASPCLDPGCKENIRVASIETDTANISIQNTGDVDTAFGGGLSPFDTVLPGAVPPQVGDVLIFVRSDGSETEARISNIGPAPDYWIEFDENVHNSPIALPWHNCYSFGNGVESDRVRDDYNQVTIDNGPKASTTLEEPYLEERRCSGLIYSGIYNSLSGVNNLNQFIQAEKITKDLNPSYGCIQKLHSRNTNLITLCEDKVLTVLANKDAMYNADGNVNVTSNFNVLGQATPASKAEYGISKNPESFASQADRIYFADKSRGAILRLGQDGLRPISSIGMKDYFSDNLRNPNIDTIIGSFDDKKGSYNVTFNNTTLSYTENARGWTSFKSFIQESGLSLNSAYYTFNGGDLWEHHANPTRNIFYGNSSFDSSIKFLFNEAPSSVKSFNTLNYEGSQARITQNLNDPDYYNNVGSAGWYVDMIRTNLQTGDNLEFKDKEGKWFSTIKGETTTLQNLDEREFSVQGIGNASEVSCPTCPQSITSWNCKVITPAVDAVPPTPFVPAVLATPYIPAVAATPYIPAVAATPYIPAVPPIHPQDTCDTFTQQNAPSLTTKSALKNWLSGIQHSTNFEFKKICIPNSASATFNPSGIVGICPCNSPEVTTGFLIGHFRWSYNNPIRSIAVGPSNMFSWDIFINTLIATGDPVFTGMATTMGFNMLLSLMQSNIASLGLNPNDYGATGLWSPTVTHTICECTPGSPGTPEVLATLGSPAVPATLGTPAIPATPGSPAIPATPGSAAIPAVCDCIEVPGTQHHPTKADCEDAVNCCGSVVVPESYNCTTSGCVDPGDGSGIYSTWCECMEQGGSPLTASGSTPCCDSTLAVGSSGYNTTRYEVSCLGTPSPPNVYGCTDSTSSNYYSAATIDDCSCGSPCVYGCMDTTQFNYNPLATCDDGSCLPIIYGCTDCGTFWESQHPGQYCDGVGPATTVGALNYYIAANIDDGTCTYCVYGCMDSTATNYDPLATCDDGTCIYRPACTPTAMVGSCSPSGGAASPSSFPLFAGAVISPSVGPGYTVTVTDDTGSCSSPNNDGGIAWSVNMPNWNTGPNTVGGVDANGNSLANATTDHWEYELTVGTTGTGTIINTPPYTPVTSPSVSIGAGSMTLAPGPYTVKIIHKLLTHGYWQNPSGSGWSFYYEYCTYYATWCVGCQ